MRVFRVQDANGRGPFRPGFSREWCDDDFAPGMLPLAATSERRASRIGVLVVISRTRFGHSGAKVLRGHCGPTMAMPQRRHALRASEYPTMREQLATTF